MTFNLLTTSEGVKMGKTEKGALWLDANKHLHMNFTSTGEILMIKTLLTALNFLLSFLWMKLKTLN